MNRSILVVLPVVAALGACTNLDAVNTLSEKLVTASKSWNDVGKEFKTSCERDQQFNDMTVCDGPAEASAKLTAANNILLNYFSALQAAANSSNFTVQPALDADAKAASAIPGINADQVKAATGLAGALAKLGTEALREDTLRKLISEGGPQAKQVIDLMAGVAPQRLGDILDAERSDTRTWFLINGGGNVPLNKEGACAAPPRASAYAGSYFLMASDYCRRVGDIAAKKKALDDYAQSLAAARMALDDLDSAKTRLGAKETIGQLFKTGKDLGDKVEAVNKAFAKDKPA